jgi:TfoX/Sxy family transcriptional regulator of competence genes
MAYDEALAQRVREAIGDRPEITERKMFGGLAFMAGGNMFIGVMANQLMCRVGAEGHDAAMSRPGASLMDFTGRPMKGYVYVGSPGIDDDAGLKNWVDESYAFATSLPPKMNKPPRTPRRKT